jgi:nitrogen-specific signal transduction histidine kinase/CheY-like chemotaxis protein
MNSEPNSSAGEDDIARVRAELVERQNKMEQVLFHAQKMNAVGALTTGIAHDFNNVFAAILLQLDLVCEYNNLPAEAREDLESAKASAARGADLVKRLLTFARPAAFEKRSSQPGDIIRDFIALIRRCITRRIQINSDISQGLWPIFADENQIILILVNLCLNARDAMYDGGTLTIDVSNVTLIEPNIPPRGRAGEFIRIRISDTGIGMTPEVLTRLYQPYFTTKERGKGVGLGLSTSQTVAKNHGGWISAESTLGRGSQFSLYLPRQSSTQPRVTEANLDGMETVLIIDSDDMTRSLVNAILSYRGYTVIEAVNLKEAIEKTTSTSCSVDLVLMDSRLSRPGNWVAVLDAIQQKKPALPILICGSKTDLDPELFIAGVINKPLEKLQLLHGIRQALTK